MAMRTNSIAGSLPRTCSTVKQVLCCPRLATHAGLLWPQQGSPKPLPPQLHTPSTALAFMCRKCEVEVCSRENK